MDHRLFKRVSAASATQFVPLSFLSLSLSPLSLNSVCLSRSLLSPCFSLALYNNTIISFWGLSLCILSLLSSLSFPPLLFLSHPSTHPTSFSITVAWCLLAWRLPTGATGGLRSSDLEQNLKLTKCLWMTMSLQHLTGTSMTLFFSVFLSLKVTFCSRLFYFCVVMQLASLRKREAFFQSCFLLLHVKWWQLWALLFDL